MTFQGNASRARSSSQSFHDGKHWRTPMANDGKMETLERFLTCWCFSTEERTKMFQTIKSEEKAHFAIEATSTKILRKVNSTSYSNQYPFQYICSAYLFFFYLVFFFHRCISSSWHNETDLWLASVQSVRSVDARLVPRLEKLKCILSVRFAAQTSR